MSKLGLIAGGGALPLSVAARCEAEGRPVFVVRLAGFADPHLARYPASTPAWPRSAASFRR